MPPTACWPGSGGRRGGCKARTLVANVNFAIEILLRARNASGTLVVVSRPFDTRGIVIQSQRNHWTTLSDSQLLSQCEVDTYRASGPGGQKRNKTSSAVRLRHPPSGLIVIAEESRSQHENRAKALQRMRQALYLKIREEIPACELTTERLQPRADYPEPLRNGGRLDLGRKDPRFWPAIGLVLDLLLAKEARLSDVAHLLGISTANLVEFLRIEPKAWAEANHLREQFGQKHLK